MTTEKTIIIDTDTLNERADVEKLAAAVAEAVPGATVSVWSTGRGTEYIGFGEGRDEAERAARAIIERLDF